MSIKSPNHAKLRRSRQLWVGLIFLMPFAVAAILPANYLPFDPFESVTSPFLPPSMKHPFGVDDLGRDLLSAVIAGARTSLFAGFAVAGIAMFIGVTVGLTAGFMGGVLDDILMRFTELVQAIPRFFVAILMVALFGGSFTTLIIVLGFTSWPGLARITRAEALSLRSREFVVAAIALGGSNFRIITRHILPHASRPVIATTTLIVTGAILTEAGLSYLGISDPNVVSWGRLIFNAQSFLHHAWWLSVFPGLAIVILVLGITFVADGIRTE